MMRIGSSTIFNSAVANMDQQQVQLAKSQQQVSTGLRMQTAADDPVAAAQALTVTQASATNKQYISNGNSAQNTLSLASSALQNVTNLIQAVQSEAIQAGNGSYSNSDRSTIATQLTSQLQQLLGLANSTDGAGNYLFSGFQTHTQPFVNTPAGTGYFGDNGQRNVQVSATQQIASSDPGANVFMSIKNGNGTFATQAAAANTGSGIINTGSVLNSAAITGDSYTIAFGGPTAQLPVPNTNTGTGTISTPTVVSQAAVTGNEYSVVFGAGGTTYSVTNTTTGQPVAGMTAQPYTSGQAITFDGLQFNITDGATPFAAGDSFTVASPGYTVTDTTTVPQALVLPAPPATGRVPYVDGQAISFGGMQVSIQGVPANGDKFSITPSSNVSIFKTISDLIATLNTPVDNSAPGGVNTSTSLANNLSYGLTNLGNALNNILTVQSSLGSRLNEISSLQTTGSSLDLQYQKNLSQLQSVDMTQAISNLAQQQTNLQAAQKSFATVSSLSLFSYLP